MGWVKLHPGSSCIGISRHFSDEGLFEKVHLVKAVAVCMCSGVTYALKINSIQPASAPLLFAYHKQANLVLPIFYQGALGLNCDMQSLQSWNYVFFILL